MKIYDEFYVSVDVEATGPIPGDYSLSSIGAFIAGARRLDGTFERFDYKEARNKFYVELKPITDNFVPEAIKVGLLEGFDKVAEDHDGSLRLQWMKNHGADAGEAMKRFADWVTDAGKRLNARPLFAAYPASFDWMYVYWYMTHFGVDSPFGFSGVRDMKEMYATKAGVPYKLASKRSMPKNLLESDAPHDHHALNDAIGQGHFLMNLLEWDGRR